MGTYFFATTAFSHPMAMTTAGCLGHSRASDPADGGDHKREVGELTRVKERQRGLR
jgi:hypothetical protein